MKFKKNIESGDNLKRETFYIDLFSGVDTIVELGVARGETSKIFMKCAKNVIGVDVDNSNLELNSLQEYAKQLGCKFTFIHASDLTIDPIVCDVLFIDTSHEEEHTYLELKKHSSSAKTFIALHDINPAIFKTLLGFNRWYAEEGSEWEEYYRDYNQCGLLVLKRKMKNGIN